jgi:hypothetical protein
LKLLSTLLPKSMMPSDGASDRVFDPWSDTVSFFIPKDMPNLSWRIGFLNRHVGWLFKSDSKHISGSERKVLFRLTSLGVVVKECPASQALALNFKSRERLKVEHDDLSTKLESYLGFRTSLGFPAGFRTQREIHKLKRRLAFVERKLSFYEEAMRSYFPNVDLASPPPPIRASWRGTLQEAGFKVADGYFGDFSNSKSGFRSLKDASDSFFARHRFPHKPRLTKKGFYENVKKAVGKLRENRGMK